MLPGEYLPEPVGIRTRREWEWDDMDGIRSSPETIERESRWKEVQDQIPELMLTRREA